MNDHVHRTVFGSAEVRALTLECTDFFGNKFHRGRCSFFDLGFVYTQAFNGQSVGYIRGMENQDYFLPFGYGDVVWLKFETALCNFYRFRAFWRPAGPMRLTKR